jgi:hypothetical protein
MSQCSALLRYLETGRSITPLSALDKFGTMRLAARIRELRERGEKIHTNIISVGRKKIAAYWLDRA